MKKFLIILFFIFLPLNAIAETKPAFETLDQVIGKEKLRTFLSASTVKAYRLGSMNVSPMMMPYFHSFHFNQSKQTISYPPQSLKAPQVQSVQKWLNQPRRYRDSLKAGCDFKPGVALEFLKEHESLVVLFCFSCNEWALESYLADQISKKNFPESLSSRELLKPQRLIYSEFGDERKELINLAKQLFPYDQEINQLK